MKLIIDAMGGDNAPLEIVKGAWKGCREHGIFPIFVGDTDKVKPILDQLGAKEEEYALKDCKKSIAMEDDPMSILRENRDCSMAEGLKLLKSDGDAFLSAGNTGALVTGASSRVIFGKTRGVKRAAIASVLPLTNPVLLMDSGANIEVTPEELLQFAVMGSAYMEHLMKVPSPRVGLINNGSESTKGTALYRESHELFSRTDSINFIGNVEGRDVPLGACDVCVCDGFVGNIILKLCEGFGKFMSASLKEMFYHDTLSKLGGLLAKKGIKDLKDRLDHKKYGGAPILGIPKPVIKAHGSSTAEAVVSAVRQALYFHENGICKKIEELCSNKSREE